MSPSKSRSPDLIDLEVLEDASGCLRTIAHPLRLRMIQMMLTAEYTVGELAEACGIPSHMASEHLGKMKDRGLLACERRGRCMYYRIAADGLSSIMECIRTHFGK
jgi:DNA-binding transcriptional ArsR family regulator